MDIQAKVAAAVAALKPSCGRDAINDLLASGFEALLTTNGLGVTSRTPGGLYVSAMKTGFYSGNPQGLQPEQREIAVLSILTLQGADANLALHVFIALASGITVADVLDTILLAGMYSGANRLTQAMRVVTKTFAAIIKSADGHVTGPAAVFECIMEEFPDPEFAAARTFLSKLPKCC